MMKLVGTFVLIVCTFLCCVKADNWDCEYMDREPTGYMCIVFGDSLDANETLIIDGTHLEAKNDSDVQFVAFVSCTTPTLPQGLTEKYPNLKYWVAKFASIEKIHPTSLTGAKNLEACFFKSNSIERLEAETFIEAINLNYLDLSDNELTFVHEHAFKNLTKLKTLVLFNNYIESLHKDIFEDSVSLEVLEVHSNLIEDLPEGLFRNSLKLKQIMLQNNNIKTIFPDTFKKLNKLNKVDLKFNICINLAFDSIYFSFNFHKETNKCTESNTWEAKNAACQKKLVEQNEVEV